MRPPVPRAVFRPRVVSPSSESSASIESTTTSLEGTPGAKKNPRTPKTFSTNPNIRMAAAMTAEQNKVHNEALSVVDSLITESSATQEETARLCAGLILDGQLPVLQRQLHTDFLKIPMTFQLPPTFTGLDASKPWLMYWPLHALGILDPDSRTDDIFSRIGPSVMACLDEKEGGFGGGNGQTAHLAATYASLNALAMSGDKQVWAQINRRKLYKWLMSVKRPDGGFSMHVGGEEDVRAVYCALASAALMNIITPELVEGTAEWVSRCQTYEGGIGGAPCNEAHGGYAFCGLAALCILGNPVEMIPKYLDVDGFVQWLSARQYQPEGGFSGRTNKLVDGCYSWWVGGCWSILEGALPGITAKDVLWSKADLQKYILFCCQSSRGGLRDKPGKSSDFYHSCYALSGLSEVQHRYSFNPKLRVAKPGEYSFMWTSELESPDIVIIDEQNIVGPLNPVHVLPAGVGERMHDFYASFEMLEL
ncbi:terpenoid cyclases/protein prenyltransferase alpha-alpha toroid [Lipomyces orientalis]|uniref:Terpenoid cyclases/protein prenyltransferase alpha-alpha toroid n=1 Tax=Lipomyces orientalis TaxID=1233043 RepID=A0ACC3TDZ7_9ASCO